MTVPAPVPPHSQETRSIVEVVKRPHYRATSRIIANTMAAEPNAAEFQAARAILAALLRHGYKVVPLND